MRVEIINVSIGHAIAFRTAFLIACALSTILGIMISFQDISSLIRNKREVRYLITPANYIVGLPRVIYHAKPVKPSERLPIGEDAVQINSPINRRPRLLVFVLGETVRAQNWGLNGYSRQTTAQLVNINGIVNFSDMHACGTSTAVSVPCLFSPFGRHNYDESRIRDHQSLLHVLERVDIKTLWRDNQSGCKGVCDGLAFNDMSKDSNHSLCSNGRCFDEILLDNLAKDIRNIPGDRFIVLHQLGNHGPSYFERYPSEYRRFTPTCDTANLGQCTREQIINSYDNAILYTDNFLARAIELVGQMKEYDSLMIYVSDHGESLGEKGLYLHGAPYSIAPKEQTKIPMTMWFSDNFLKDNSINMDCLNKRSESYTDHDVIFSTVLSFFQVKTSIYDESRDLFYSCALSR
jgi:lipid A ethanolaminephosphotransferase